MYYLSKNEPRPRSLQQSRRYRRYPSRRRRNKYSDYDQLLSYCHLLLSSAPYILARQMLKVKVIYQIVFLLVVGLVLLCLSGVFTSTPTTKVQQSEEVSSSLPHGSAASQTLTTGKKIVYESTTKCNNRHTCRQSQLAFHLMSGVEMKGKPYICLNGTVILKNEDSGRGLNMVVVDGNINEVVITRHVDTYSESHPSLTEFLMKIADGDVLIAVTADDASRMLSADVRNILARDFNSLHITEMVYRSAWIFIGQKGVKSSVKIEKLNMVHGQWAEKAELHGCLSIPMNTTNSTVESRRDQASNCNIQKECDNGLIPMAMKSGVITNGVRETPNVCVDGKQVMGQTKIGDYEPGSRGLNCIIFDPNEMKVVKIGRFDTYISAVDDSMAYAFLENIQDEQIILIAVYDEAYRKLSFKTKSLLHSLGSSKIKDFNFRDNWLFISQKGIMGFTPYEQVGFKEGSGWGAKLEMSECIPLKIQGVRSIEAIGSRKKNDFCKEYDEYPDLCSDANINKSMQPLPLDDSSLISNMAYKLPIAVVPGYDLASLQKCLSSLLAIPGLRPSNVVVILDNNFSGPNNLVRLYDFRIEYTKSKSDYQVLLHAAISQAFELFKEKDYLIVIQDYMEVTPDFLRYFSQTLPILGTDPTILTISAWNPNGFDRTSGDESLVYRVEGFPGFGWVLRKSLWSDRMDSKQKTCCNQPTWKGWNLGQIQGGEMIIPDVSRIRKIDRKGGYYEEKKLMTVYLANRTSSSAGPQSEPTEVYKLETQKYENEILRLVTKSIPLTSSLLAQCLKGGGLSVNFTNGRNMYSVFYMQVSLDDHTLLRQLCKCFGLFVFEDFPMSNMHRGIIRFTHKGNYFILVGSETVYFNNKPSTAEVITSLPRKDDNG